MTNIKPLYILQRREILITKNVNSYVYKPEIRLLPDNLQNFFLIKFDDEDHRRKFNFKSPYARTTLKQMYISVQTMEFPGELFEMLLGYLSI